MSQVKKNKRSVGEFILTYRKVIILALFFVLLPIVVVIGVYSGTKANGQKVKFTETGEVISTKKFKSVEDFQAFNLTVKCTDIDELKEIVEEVEKRVGEKYTFSFIYEQNIQDISNVSVSVVLVAPWSTFQVIPQINNPLKLSKGIKQTMNIEFKKMVPYSPLWFVKVTHPILYLEVKYTPTGGKELIEYLKYDFSTEQDIRIHYDR